MNRRTFAASKNEKMITVENLGVKFNSSGYE